MQPELDAPTLDLRGFLSVLRRRASLIVVVVLLVSAGAVVLTTLNPPRYVSEADVEVRPLTIDEQLQPVGSSSIVNMETEATRVTQEQVTTRAARLLGLDHGSASDLRLATEGVDVSIRPNTTYLEIACSRASATDAQACSQAFAEAYVDDRVARAKLLYETQVANAHRRIGDANRVRQQLLEELAAAAPEDRPAIRQQIAEQEQVTEAALTDVLSLPGASPDAAVLSRSADLPTRPANRDYVFVVAFATMFGALIGVVLALFRERLAEPITDGETFADALGAPVLAVVPDDMRRPGRPEFASGLSAPGSPASMAYRVARTMLLHIAGGDGSKVFAVVAVDNYGDATRTTAELGIALAQPGKRVVAASGNLVAPALHRLLGVENTAGLTSLMTHQVRIDQSVQVAATPGLFVIPSGPTSDTPSEVRDADAIAQVMNEIRARFDLILLDSPPAAWVADTLSLVPSTDGVIITADGGRTLRSDVSRIREQIGFFGGRIVGGVLYARPSRATRWIRRVRRLFRAPDRRKQRAVDRPKTVSDARRTAQPLDATSGASDANTA
jgi:Mrp family chromosome partitioning ATPase/capsular polysaccharide biosynthesis protein